MITTHDAVKLQSDIQTALRDALTTAALQNLSHDETIQLLSQEALHCMLTSNLASQEALQWYLTCRSVTNAATTWVDEVHRLDRIGATDKLIMLMASSIQQISDQKQFDVLDRIISELQVQYLSVAGLVIFLQHTFVWRHHLPAWQALITRTRKELIARGFPVDVVMAQFQ